MEAAHEKYVSDTSSLTADSKAQSVPIKFGNKVAEEVGFEKIRKLLSELQELRIVVLDGMRISGVLAERSATPAEREAELKNIKRTSPKITELNLSRNLFENLSEVTDICLQLDELRILKLE